ncbi:hypothetical protein HMPREF9248_0397 [Fannyhessea vaginae PB189-T1-4]|uniref:Uncharacterized protein n=1 Tax=Fannyhessea vaginae PB189-T1-4 TaxID=866774 RepID=A0ABN0B0U2_9ACTN|nr:hypothetical protein HMPREF9248_0397 [Fannyhessea vaginae PB189-T1-4]
MLKASTCIETMQYIATTMPQVTQNELISTRAACTMRSDIFCCVAC